MSSITQPANKVRTEAKGSVEKIPFESVRDPGAYLCHWSGHLLRVPREVAAAGRSARMSIVSSETLLVTRISDDPEVPAGRARALANEVGLKAAF